MARIYVIDWKVALICAINFLAEMTDNDNSNIKNLSKIIKVLRCTGQSVLVLTLSLCVRFPSEV